MNYDRIQEFLRKEYLRMLCDESGDFKHKALLPVSSYACQLWDWGCWLSNVAIRRIATDLNKEAEILDYERGCVWNFLDFQKEDGSIDIVISSEKDHDLNSIIPHKNMHKPVLAQHVLFISKNTGSAEWIRSAYDKLEKFIAFYENNAKHESGLFYFFDDFAIGVDNDPCTFYRPDNSSASIFLNTLMYKELGAMASVSQMLGYGEKEAYYKAKQEELKNAINTYCYDEKDGMYYSCDILLRPISDSVLLHSGAPRHYSTLIQRIGVWSSFLPLWAGIPDKNQAERMIKENLLDEKAFWAKYGVRSLSKYEKMYRIVGTGNPSSWQGGVWIISNYLVYVGLKNYGYEKEARALADKTIELLDTDLRENGAFHEYYDPDTGKGVYNKDFLSWNMLVANMIADIENKKPIFEF